MSGPNKPNMFDGKNRLLFSNNFINPTVTDSDDPKLYVEKMNSFRQFYINKNKFKELHKVPETIQAITPPEVYHQKDLMSTNAVNGIETTGEQMLNASASQSEDERFYRIRKTLVNIDSRDRNLAIYPKPNNYTISLNQTFINVKEITLRSSEFPNSEQLIRDAPASKSNNKIYWQDAGFNDVFTASIPAGNYRPSTLQTAIQSAMNLVKRPGSDKYHEFTVIIDTVSNICTFSSLVTVQLSNPFTSIAGTQTLLVQHEAHGFFTGDFINVQGASTFSGINASLINTDHVVTVVDENSYYIELPSIVVQSNVDSGGSTVRIGVGQKFSLLFDQPYTPAQILGFETVQTPYSSIQTNTTIAEQYNIEQVKRIDSIFSAITTVENQEPLLVSGDRVYITDVSGTSADQLINDPAGFVISNLTSIDQIAAGLTTEQGSRTFKIPATISSLLTATNGKATTRLLNRPVKLAGENYILMQSPQIGGMINTGNVSNIFAKIDLSAPPGSILFNTHIANPKKYDSPLDKLSELTFTFVDQNGDFFEFLDSDHSFTLEIKESIHEVSSGVGLSSKLGFRDTN